MDFDENEFGSNPMDDDEAMPEPDEPKQEAKKAEPEAKKMSTHIKIDSSELNDYLSEINRLATIINQSQKSLTEIEKSFTIVNKLKAISELNVYEIQKSFTEQLQNMDLGLYVKRAVEIETTTVVEIIKAEIKDLLKNYKQQSESVMEVMNDELMELVESYKHQNDLLKNIILNDEWVIEKSDKPKLTFWQKTKSGLVKVGIVLSLIAAGYFLNPMLSKVKIVDNEPQKQEANSESGEVKRSYPKGTVYYSIATGEAIELEKQMNNVPGVLDEEGNLIYKLMLR